MKNVFIGGTIRSGKSTLSKMIYHDLHYSILELDTIVHSFTKIFPELGIDEKHPKDLDKNFAPFAYEVLKCCDYDRKYGNIKVCINGFQLQPDTIANFKRVNDLIVIYLGISDATEEELLKKIRETEQDGDWTKDKTDASLLHICKNIIDTSNIIKKQCQNQGFMYFDTFKDREKTLHEIVEYLRINN